MLTVATANTCEGADWKVIVPLIVGALGFLGVIITLWVSGRRAHKERLRELYAGGWAAVQGYKEMAFAIRRRNAEHPGGERVRLSETLCEIQRDLSFHEALIGRERSGSVAAAYRGLVTKTREIAGGIIRCSWNEDSITSDKDVHSPEIASELAVLKPVEDDYMRAVSEDLSSFWSRSRHHS